jgi:serine/threonine protein kinase
MARPHEEMRLDSAKQRVYVLKERLGGGGFASVWRALDEETNDSYAIKIFETTGSLETPEQAEEASRRELVALMDIRGSNCPYLIRVDEAFKDIASGLYCIVMNLVEGDSLKDRM